MGRADIVVQDAGKVQHERGIGYLSPSQTRGKPWLLARTIDILFAGVWCGASCFEQFEIVHHNRCLRKIFGWNRGAGHKSYMRYFDKFSQADNQRVFTNLYQWFFVKSCFDNYTLDFDSTVEQRCGEQEGAAKGYNPKRPGRQSHHPLLLTSSLLYAIT